MTTEDWIMVASYLFPLLVIVALLVESCSKAATIRRLRKERNAAWEGIRNLSAERDRALRWREVLDEAAEKSLLDREPGE